MTNEWEKKTTVTAFRSILAQYKYTTETMSTIKKTVTRKRSTPYKKEKEKPRSYRVYSHLTSTPDHLAYGMLILFVGINPGLTSATQQHHYAYHGNAFWPCMSSIGLGTLTYEDDHRLPRDFNLGLTCLVARPSKTSSELRRAEYKAGAAILNAKIRRWRPLLVCFVGKGIFEHWAGHTCQQLGLQEETFPLTRQPNLSIEEYIKDAELEMQTAKMFMSETLDPSEQIVAPHGTVLDRSQVSSEVAKHADHRQHAHIFVMPSTSGRVYGVSLEEKMKYFQDAYQIAQSIWEKEQPN
jgi:G:T/U-mismatch repair DNA glycosylase